jgi:hypothetical protein
MTEPRFWEKNHGFDADGRERREQCMAIADCPVCGKEVELVADTESRFKGDDGRWHHDEYGPAQGVCCNRLIVDYWEGCFVYNLEDKK